MEAKRSSRRSDDDSRHSAISAEVMCPGRLANRSQSSRPGAQRQVRDARLLVYAHLDATADALNDEWGSIFVTSGGVNPTNTIQALALYVADHIKRNLTTLFD